MAAIAYIGIYVIVISKLGREQLGLWSIITALPTVISFLGTGVAGSLIKYIPTYQTSGQSNQVNQLVGNGLFFNFLLAAIITILALIFDKRLLHLMLGETRLTLELIHLFYLALCCFFINFLSSVFLSALDGLQKIPLKNKILMVSSIFFCVSAVLLIHGYQLKGLFIAQLLQSFLVFVFSAIALVRVNSFKFHYRMISLHYLRIFYTYGSKFQYISILNIIFEPATKYFLNRYFGLSAVGTFDLVNRVVGQLRTLMVNAIQVIVPFVTKSLKETDTISTIYQRSFRGAMLLCSILFGVLISGSFSLGYFFHKINIFEFQLMMGYLVFGYMFNVLSTPAYAIRLAKGQLSFLLIAQALSTGLNILLFVLLGQAPSMLLVLFPTALAMAIPSIYLILSFGSTLSASFSFFNSKDSIIYLVSILFPMICAGLSLFYSSFYLSMFFGTLHGIILIALIYKNEFLMDVFYTLMRRKKTDYAAY